ncbi:HD domain-containing protein [Desulfococcaceae bacterium HSG8]|nr:HD domain-containing protein [Desulfococcaceae bacterium HSG8]
MNNIQLSNLINTDLPDAVSDEVQVILNLISPQFNTIPISSAFATIVEIYKGNYPGYKACNTEYHDLRHTMNVVLAMARLLHGAMLDHENFIDRDITISLIAAIFHDVGYIQEEWDHEGSGGKYTFTSVRRSADFLRRYGVKHGLSDKEIARGRSMIFCTKIASNIYEDMPPDDDAEFLGRMLCVADMLAQMSDRTYLEKLLFLYHEVRECNLANNFDSEIDILQKTSDFYEFISRYIEVILEPHDHFMRLHFASRWNIQKNLYSEAIEKQREYLNRILNIPGTDPRDYLKRDGIVRKVRDKYEK